MPAIVIVYLVLSLVMGILGRRTFIGFWGNFIFSLFFSPIPSMIYILVTRAYNKLITKQTV
jgi:hypothetical protein